MDTYWITRAVLVERQMLTEGALRVSQGRIADIRSRAPRRVNAINMRGAFLAPGFIDLHIWGDPAMVSQDAVRYGTTAFVSALGPAPRRQLLHEIMQRSSRMRGLPGAQCLGLHLEGPFLNPKRAGALPARWMRRPSLGELSAWMRAGRMRVVTIAPELPGALSAIAWCRKHRIVASLGHSDADASIAARAIGVGATAVTHVFNGMRPFHHRNPTLLDVALTDPRATAMVILDGVHISAPAFRLLVSAKGPGGIALVTDSIRYQDWNVVWRRALPSGHGRRIEGAYYTRAGTLAGSRLTMSHAVQRAVEEGGVTIPQAVRMASHTPARVLGLQRTHGTLRIGARADLVALDQQYRVRTTIVAGTIVYER